MLKKSQGDREKVSRDYIVLVEKNKQLRFDIRNLDQSKNQLLEQVKDLKSKLNSDENNKVESDTNRHNSNEDQESKINEYKDRIKDLDIEVGEKNKIIEELNSKIDHTKKESRKLHINSAKSEKKLDSDISNQEKIDLKNKFVEINSTINLILSDSKNNTKSFEKISNYISSIIPNDNDYFNEKLDKIEDIISACKQSNIIFNKKELEVDELESDVTKYPSLSKDVSDFLDQIKLYKKEYNHYYKDADKYSNRLKKVNTSSEKHVDSISVIKKEIIDISNKVNSQIIKQKDKSDWAIKLAKNFKDVTKDINTLEHNLLWVNGHLKIINENFGKIEKFIKNRINWYNKVEKLFSKIFNLLKSNDFLNLDKKSATKIFNDVILISGSIKKEIEDYSKKQIEINNFAKNNTRECKYIMEIFEGIPGILTFVHDAIHNLDHEKMSYFLGNSQEFEMLKNNFGNDVNQVIKNDNLSKELDESYREIEKLRETIYGLESEIDEQKQVINIFKDTINDSNKQINLSPDKDSEINNNGSNNNQKNGFHNRKDILKTILDNKSITNTNKNKISLTDILDKSGNIVNNFSQDGDTQSASEELDELKSNVYQLAMKINKYEDQQESEIFNSEPLTILNYVYKHIEKLQVEVNKASRDLKEKDGSLKDKLNESNEELQSILNENKDQSKKIEKYLSEIELKNKLISKDREKIIKLEVENSNFIDKIQELNNRLEDLDSEVKTKDADTDFKSSQISKFKKEYFELVHKKTDVDQKLKIVKEQFNNSEKEKNEILEELTNVKEDHNKYLKKFESLKEENNKLFIKLKNNSEAEKLLFDIKKDHSILKRKEVTYIQTIDNLSKKTNEELPKLVELCQSRKEKINDLLEKIKDKDSLILKSSEGLNNLKRKIKKLTTTLEGKDDKIDDLRNDLLSIKHKYSEKLHDIQSNKERLDSKYSLLNEKLAKREEIVYQIKTQFTKIKSKLTETEKDLIRNNEKLTHKNSELTNKNNIINDLKSQINEFQNHILKFNSENNNSGASNNNISIIEQQNIHISSLKRQLDKTEFSFVKARREIENLKTQIAEKNYVENENTGLKREIKKLDDIVNNKAAQLNELNEKLESNQGDIKEITNQVSFYENIVKENNYELDKKSKKIKELKKKLKVQADDLDSLFSQVKYLKYLIDKSYNKDFKIENSLEKDKKSDNTKSYFNSRLSGIEKTIDNKLKKNKEDNVYDITSKNDNKKNHDSPSHTNIILGNHDDKTEKNKDKEKPKKTTYSSELLEVNEPTKSLFNIHKV